VPVPKKGDLSSFDNWRGISLLDVVGKVFAKIVQQRLLVIVEEEVAGSQCGFHCNRGFTDMIFCACQLIEKAIEQSISPVCGSNDSVPREAMWLILIKYGVPVKLVNLINSISEDMQAGISVGDGVTQVVVSEKGCVLAPTLFFCSLIWLA